MSAVERKKRASLADQFDKPAPRGSGLANIFPRNGTGALTRPAPTEPPSTDKPAGNSKDEPHVATATADPLLEPPGVWAGFQGFLVGDGSMQANSVVTVLPIMIAPAFFSRVTVVASYSGTNSSYTLEQAVVGMPAV